MKNLRFAALVLAGTCLAASAVASAADFEAAEPSAYWRLDFGGPERTAALHYGLSLRQLDRDPADFPLPALAALDFSPRGANLKVAGLPLWSRQYLVHQTGEIPATEGEVTEGGWLSDLGDAFAGLGLGTGTMIVAGGVAVAVMLLSTDADDNPPGPGGNDDGPGDGGDPSVCIARDNTIVPGVDAPDVCL